MFILIGKNKKKFDIYTKTKWNKTKPFEHIHVYMCFLIKKKVEFISHYKNKDCMVAT